MNLKNKKILISGATGGIGNSLVDKFHSLGAIIVATGTNEEKLNKEVLKVVDTRYGKPYEEETTKECDNFIFKLIPGSKDEIKKIAESGIY